MGARTLFLCSFCVASFLTGFQNAVQETGTDGDLQRTPLVTVANQNTRFRNCNKSFTCWYVVLVCRVLSPPVGFRILATASFGSNPGRVACNNVASWVLVLLVFTGQMVKRREDVIL